MKETREEIDKVNCEILDLLAKRMKLVKKIGEYKKERDIPVEDSEREKQIYEKIEKLAEEKELNKEFVKKLFEDIITQAKKEEM